MLGESITVVAVGVLKGSRGQKLMIRCERERARACIHRVAHVFFVQIWPIINHIYCVYCVNCASEAS